MGHDSVAAYFSTPSTAQPHIESGRLVALATTGLTRPQFLASVPTLAESGFDGFNAANWYAFVALGKTPAQVLERWNQELVNVLSAPDVRKALLDHGMLPHPGSRDDLARFIDSESRTWGKLIRERRISVD